MLEYSNEFRRQLALEKAELLAAEMRHSRRPTPADAGYPNRPGLGELLRRAARLGRAQGQRRHIPAYHA